MSLDRYDEGQDMTVIPRLDGFLEARTGPARVVPVIPIFCQAVHAFEGWRLAQWSKDVGILTLGLF